MMAQEDPFSSVRISPQKFSEQQASPQENDPFSQVRIKKAEGFPGLYETGRHAARISSRIAETLGGIPGDVNSLIQSGIFAGMEKLTGKKVSPENKALAKSRYPTSSELKEFSIKKTKGFTKPQSEAEKIGDEIATTAASLLGPMKFRRALWVASGSQAVKEGIKTAGFKETPQEAGKLGTMFLLSMINPGGAMKYASSQYEKANQLAKGASIKATTMESNLKNLQKDLKKGVSTSDKDVVFKPIKELLEKINGGKIPVDELTAAKRDVNKLMGQPETLSGAKKLLKVVGKEIDTAIKPYEQINPAFKKVYRPANEIYGAVMQGNKVSNFIKRTLGGKPMIAAALTGAGEALSGYPEAIIPTLVGAAAIGGGAKGIDFFTRVAKSPELQKYYTRAMTAATLEDAASLRIYADKIENLLNTQKSE